MSEKKIKLLVRSLWGFERQYNAGKKETELGLNLESVLYFCAATTAITTMTITVIPPIFEYH